MARHQTAARGRRGRAWANPRGNFAATLLLRPDVPPAEAALNSFVAACATYMALRDFADHQGYALKWPNDIMLNGGKVAGILLESSGSATRVDWLAIGIGANLSTAPSVEDIEARALRPVSVLEETGVAVRPEALLERLACHFDMYTNIVMAKAGFDGIRRLWLRWAANLGETITARTGHEEITGTFETVDMTGALVLNTAKGRRAIPAADIYF